jgi:hypothetical protein
MTVHERCPECGAPDPPPVKTCANETCDRTFRRSEGGRADAIYCRRSCAKAQAMREFRRREKH